MKNVPEFDSLMELKQSIMGLDINNVQEYA
jgi:hypothetical protein